MNGLVPGEQSERDIHRSVPSAGLPGWRRNIDIVT